MLLSPAVALLLLSLLHSALCFATHAPMQWRSYAQQTTSKLAALSPHWQRQRESLRNTFIEKSEVMFRGPMASPYMCVGAAGQCFGSDVLLVAALLCCLLQLFNRDNAIMVCCAYLHASEQTDEQ